MTYYSVQLPLYKSENTGLADKILSSVNVIRRFYSAKLLYSIATKRQNKNRIIKLVLDNGMFRFGDFVLPDHESMVGHGQVHGRFSSLFPSKNENDHVTMPDLDIYMHGKRVLSSSIGTHVHGQHGHVNIWSIIALKSDHEGDHNLTMPDHVLPNFAGVIQNVAL